MPHVIVKLWPTENEDKKIRLAKRIAEVIDEVLEIDVNSTSVAIMEIKKENWKEEVFDKDIVTYSNLLYKNPGYKY